jgi:AcrR family transcriptional regulator
MSTPTLTRRERVRLQTLGEIKQHALAQVADGGVAALSLNAIAKAMGMSGPAIYRYFGSRDELLAALVTDGYAELADTVTQAARATARRAPARRLAAVTEVYRAWARANPYRYDLLFSVRPPTYSDPTEAIAAIQPAMVVLLELLGEIAGATGAPESSGKLERQLLRWAEMRGGGVDSRTLLVLKLGVLTWSRLHGIVSLELAGILGDMGLDAQLLIQAELDDVVATAAGSR